MKKQMLKLASIMWQLLFYFVIVTGAHEMGHMIVANNVGVEGYVLFRLDWGFFVFSHPETITTFQDVIVGLGGGFFVAFLFGISWAFQHWQAETIDTEEIMLDTDTEGHIVSVKYKPSSEVDTAAIFAMIVLLQFCYALFEGFQIWLPWAREWSQLIGIIAGLVIAGKLYGMRLLEWIEK